MNKRQKKKLFKKTHGFNPTKEKECKRTAAPVEQRQQDLDPDVLAICTEYTVQIINKIRQLFNGARRAEFKAFSEKKREQDNRELNNLGTFTEAMTERRKRWRKWNRSSWR